MLARVEAQEALDAAAVRFPASRWHAPVIAAVAASYQSPTYVEIGVWRGDCLSQVAPHCGQAHGVDVSFERVEHDVGAARLWQLPSDEFFERYDGPAPDVIFVDGDHEYDQARRDAHNALAILAPQGVLFLHDTWPVFRAATARLLCGGVHRVVEELEADASLEVVTIRRWPGLSLVTRRGPAFLSGQGQPAATAATPAKARTTPARCTPRSRSFSSQRARRTVATG